MKFKVHNQEFMTVAQTVIKGISKDQQVQSVMKVAELEELNGELGLVFQVSSSNSFFKGHVKLLNIENQENEVLEWGIDGNQLKTILSIITPEDTDITFEMLNSNRSFKIIVGDNKFKLPVYEYPALNRESVKTKIGVVKANDLLKNLSSLSKLANTHNAIQSDAISCLQIRNVDNKMVYMASNAIGIAEVKQEIDNPEDFTILIKPAQANLLLSSNFGPNDTVELYQTSNMFGYVDSYGTLSLVNRHEFAPTQYAGFLTLASEEQTVDLDVKEFKYAIDSLIKLAPSDLSLNFEFTKDELKISNSNLDEIFIKIDADINDVKMVIHKPTLSLLISLVVDKFRLAWSASTSDTKKLVQIILLDNDGNKVEDTFIGTVTND